MPELPEVEITRRQLHTKVVGQIIRSVRCTSPSYFFLTPPRTLANKLRNQKVCSLERRGKYLLMTLASEHHLLLHLGMTGQLFLSGSQSPRLMTLASHSQSPKAFQPDHHTHLQLKFEGSAPALYFRDVRKFGKVRLLDPGQSDPRLDKLGPDALTIQGPALHAASRSRKLPLKSLLLDQKVLAGVGNIYADEALFRCGLNPIRPALQITKKECNALAASIRKVLKRSIDTGGSSISDFVAPDGSDGGFQNERLVYAREGEPCATCKMPIARTVVGQRSTHFCPRCQAS